MSRYTDHPRQPRYVNRANLHVVPGLKNDPAVRDIINQWYRNYQQKIEPLPRSRRQEVLDQYTAALIQRFNNGL